MFGSGAEDEGTGVCLWDGREAGRLAGWLAALAGVWKWSEVFLGSAAVHRFKYHTAFY